MSDDRYARDVVDLDKLMTPLGFNSHCGGMKIAVMKGADHYVCQFNRPTLEADWELRNSEEFPLERPPKADPEIQSRV